MDQTHRLERALSAIKSLRARLALAESDQREPIAIIGLGCRFPGAPNPEAYWDVLVNGRDVIGETPARSWELDLWYDEDPAKPGKMSVRHGGFLDNVEDFDAGFFNISPREAQVLDPQQRLLLEVCWETLEHAGIPADSLSGSRVGIFAGISGNDFAQRVASRLLTASDGFVGTGTAHSVAVGRVAHFLGLRGPAVALDTACSSSLVAVHLASNALRNRDCELALAGGVNLILTPYINVNHSKAGMLARDGRCKTFDSKADGFVRSEGCGLVALKRLSSALRDGDPVLGVISGSAINHDGHASGITVPSRSAQRDVMRQALEAATCGAGDVAFVEAHGTGTELGDPIELRAIDEVYGRGREPEDRLWVGSVKTNMGHLESAAGIAGLIKAVLSLRHGQVPPNLHFNEPTPAVNWDALGMRVPIRNEPLKKEGRCLSAGISSFGFGGTNAHVIVSQYDGNIPQHSPGQGAAVLALSAKTPSSLEQKAAALASWWDKNRDVDTTAVCFNAGAGRAQLPHRMALVVTPDQDVKALLKKPKTPGPDLFLGEPSQYSETVFLFTGQGAQYAGMGKDLYQSESIFRGVIDRCHELSLTEMDRPLRDVLFPKNGGDQLINNTRYTQPCMYALGCALTALLRHQGITPQKVLGHSIGEFAAAQVAGVFSLEDGFRLVAARARLMGDLPEGGAMAVVRGAAARVAPLLEGNVVIAAYNGPANTVISGPSAELDRICEALKEQGLKVVQLTVSHAFHSPLMAPMLDAFRDVCERVAFRAPQLDFVSTHTGQLVYEELVDPSYWVNQLSQPVMFAQAMEEVGGDHLFVEIGPKPALIGMGRQIGSDKSGIWLPCLQPGVKADHSLARIQAAAFTRGTRMPWRKILKPAAHLNLPTYPFERRRYWAPEAELPNQLMAEAAPSSLDEKHFVAFQWQAISSPEAAEPSVQPIDYIFFGDAMGHLEKTLGVRVATRVYMAEDFSSVENGFCINPEDPEDFHRLLDRLAESDTRDIVFAWGPLVRGAASPQKMGDLAVVGLLHLCQALYVHGEHWRLRLVTTEAQAVDAHLDLEGLLQAPLWGMGKVIALEKPEIWAGMIDLEKVPASSDFAQSCAIPDEEDISAYRHGIPYVARLRHVDRPKGGALSLTGTALITGGTGAFGLACAHELVRLGVRSLVLLSRSGRVAPELASSFQALCDHKDVSISIEKVDIADSKAMAGLQGRLEKLSLPLQGIIHAAGMAGYDDTLEIDCDTLRSVLAPKVAGSLNLLPLARNNKLDYVVLCSSLVALWGAASQAHYVAANQFLDTFAHYLRGMNIPAVSVNWGPMLGGMLSKEASQTLEEGGVATMTMENAASLLRHLLGSETVQTSFVDIDWGHYIPLFQTRRQRPLFKDISEGSTSIASHKTLDHLKATPMGEWKDLLLDHLSTVLSRLLSLAPDQSPDPYQGFFEMGMDSLIAVEFHQALEAELGLSLPSTLAFDYGNCMRLADFLVDQIPLLEASEAHEDLIDESDVEAELKALEAVMKRT